MTRPSLLAALLALALVGVACPGALAQSTLGAAPKDTTDCEVAIVGGGPAGVYTAFRLLETNSSTNVCLFEATHRVGGRVYSVRNLGPNGDLTLDMGAYRYMPLTQPIITNLIENYLKLPNRLYQPGVPDYKIVLTPDGSNAGFATWVEALLTKAIGMGLQLKFNSEIIKLSQTPGGITLTQSDGGNTTAERVVLNLPSRPLRRLMQASFLPDAAPVNEQLLNFYQIRACKLYLYYPNAWWIANGMNNGSLALNPLWNQTAPAVPIIGRYHDGHVKCKSLGPSGSVAAASVSSGSYVDYYYENSNSLDTNNCYGYIQATYTNDGGTTNTSHFALDYLVDYASPTPNPQDGYSLPYSVWDNSTAMGAKLLADAHSQIVAYQNSAKKPLSNAVATSLPTQAIVAFWDPSIKWSGGAWHNTKVNNASEGDMVELGIKPFPDLELYVADEAYGTQLGWSEGGLVMAENIVQDYFGATRPDWMSPATQAAAKFGPTFTDIEAAAQICSLLRSSRPIRSSLQQPQSGSDRVLAVPARWRRQQQHGPCPRTHYVHDRLSWSSPVIYLPQAAGVHEIAFVIAEWPCVQLALQ